MRVLQLGKFYPIKGGVEKVMYDLMSGLSESDYGIDCDMLCGNVEHGSRRMRLNGHAQIICSRTMFRLASTMITPSMILTLRKECRHYDLIHVHHPDPMAALALYCSGYKGKVVLHWHSDVLKQRLLLKLYKPLQDWLIRRADRIVCTTPVMKEESSYLQDVQDKTIVIPIGIEPLEVKMNSVKVVRKQYKGKKIVFSLGRLVEYKGYPYLIEAAKYLPDNYVVVIGGEGPLWDDLNRQVIESGLRKKVVLLGFIANEQRQAYYGACDVYCMSSILKTEAFGIVQIEAMSCGKPVVATNIGGSGVSWVNKHGYSGLNVEPRNAKALAEAIVAVTEEKETYARYCEQATSRYWKTFTQNRMLDACAQLYDELLNRDNQKQMSMTVNASEMIPFACDSNVDSDIVSARLCVKAKLKLREVGEQYLLVDSQSSDVDFTRVFEMNKTAAWMWTKASELGTFTASQLVELMTEVFDADSERIYAGVLRQLHYWKENGLLNVATE